MTHGLLIAAPKSGAGKTTVTLGLLRAFARRGLRVGAFKCGPDYIDPAFHRVATGQTSLNLDSWAMAPALLDAHFAATARDMDVVIGEGSMGLFDGVALPGATGDGASADIAARYGLPVVLVVDVSGQSQSAGAVALGFAHFRPDVRIAGVILANSASDRHTMLAARGVERAGLRLFGGLPRGGVPAIPERHLGLVQAGELPRAAAMIDELAEAMEQRLDIDRILEAAAALPLLAPDAQAALPPPGQRIALAADVAFSFAYPHVLQGWRRAGAEILPFSPLADQAPDPDADVCWLPGGYPELHAGQLAGNTDFFDGLRAFAQTRPVHGECGGYMVLGDSLTDAEGRDWPMAGLLPVATSFAARKLHLGYRAVTLAADGPLGRAGALVRGHEFHYASILRQDLSCPLGHARDANGTDLGPVGQRNGLVSGSFFHAIANCE